jgi:putative transcriptional regulator
MRAWATLVLLLAGLAPLPAQPLAAGTILLANPDLPDPNFSQTVILLIHADDDGAMGLILNRAAHTTLQKLFPEMALPKNGQDAVYSGGPVEEAVGFALLRSSTKVKPALRVSGEVYLVSDKELLQKNVLAGKDGKNFRVFLGYAGWGPDQLEREMAADAWTIMPAKDEIVFDAEPATLWDRLNKKSNLRIALAR